MSNNNEIFPAFIKEICKTCHVKNKMNPLKKDGSIKRCIGENCNGSRPIYINAKPRYEIVRDLFNNHKTVKSLKKCINELNPKETCQNLEKCPYAHNDFEYFVWNTMLTGKYVTKISEIFNIHFDPYIYIPIVKQMKHVAPIPLNIINYSDMKKISVPMNSKENELIKEAEKRKNYFCWFCMKHVASENDVLNHINGRIHQVYYNADKMRNWYFKLPANHLIEKCIKDNCTCDSPHCEDEFQEMKARLYFRSFMLRYEIEIGEETPMVNQNIIPWPPWIELTMGKFPSNLNSYNNGSLQLIVSLKTAKDKCENIIVSLFDNESRPFFKLIPTEDRQIVKNKRQSLSMVLDPNITIPNTLIEFAIEFKPMYSNTFCQRIEFQLKIAKRTYIFYKRIRVDVGNKENLTEFKEMWEKYGDVVKKNMNESLFIPFNINEIDSPVENLNETLLSSVFKVFPNLNWINTNVQNYNYCEWMKTMIILEELEQRLILSQFEYNGTLELLNMLTDSKSVYPANDGLLYGEITFDSTHNWPVRYLIIDNVKNGYLIKKRKSSHTLLFEFQLVDKFRYFVDKKSIRGVTICLSKKTVDTLQMKAKEKVDVRVVFCFDRLEFQRRHNSLKHMPKYDKLSYNPLVCPYYTRLPYGDDDSLVSFNPLQNLNEEQNRLPRLVLRKLNSDEIALPFVLNGAFGTGKSLLFAETIITILNTNPSSNILLCTRSYSAHNSYLKIFKTKMSNFASKIKRIVGAYKRDKIEMNDFNIFSDQINHDTFIKNRLFIATLDSCSTYLMPFVEYLRKASFFKYIFVDEAAQILEVDAIIVYQLGNQHCKFIFSGDIFQMKPELYNKKLQMFTTPIIKRLYKNYSSIPDYKITLVQVYRTHKEIVTYLAKAIYYDQPLVSLMKDLFPKLFPMKFVDSNSLTFQCHYDAIYDDNFGSYKNLREADLVIGEIISLIRSKKTNFDHKMILVCSPFYAQVHLIRQRLRIHGMKDIVVELPSGIQGLEFNAVFISTVLTDSQLSEMSVTFHNSKNLINTVISRSKYFVEVVGDKGALVNSLTGKEWDIYIDMCKL